MGSYRTRKPLSAILTSALLILTVVAAPWCVALAQGTDVAKPILSADQQRILVNVMAVHGHDVALYAPVTAALGLSKGDEVLTLRQLNVTERPVHHAYIPLPDGGVLLIYSDLTIASSYRLDPNLKLLAAVSQKQANEAPVVIPVPEAERNVQTELAFWAAIANNP